MEQSAKPPEAPKPKNRTVMLAVIIVVILIVVGVGVYILIKPPGTSTTSGPKVTINDDGLCSTNDASCLFTPATINATVNGAAVVWNNNGKAGHTVTTCDSANSPTSTECPNGMDAAGLDSVNLSVTAGSSVSHTFTKAGTYYYFCAIHPWMHGEVVVS
jgi:plastocyanin